jgi:hypothetical protein
MKILSVFGVGLFCVFFAQALSSKEWRGLAPLRSTRVDVERLLGPPDVNAKDELLTYYLPDSTVNIQFAANPQCKQKLPYGTWNVLPQTVTVIRVGLKNHIPLSETGIDLSKLKKIPGDSDVEGHFYYTNIQDGFSYEVGGNFLMGYIYEPASKNENLRCPAN